MCDLQYMIHYFIIILIILSCPTMSLRLAFGLLCHPESSIRTTPGSLSGSGCARMDINAVNPGSGFAIPSWVVFQRIDIFPGTIDPYQGQATYGLSTLPV